MYVLKEDKKFKSVSCVFFLWYLKGSRCEICMTRICPPPAVDTSECLMYLILEDRPSRVHKLFLLTPPLA